MAARNESELFIFGDEFDAILSALEEDEQVERELLQAVDNVSSLN